MPEALTPAGAGRALHRIRLVLLAMFVSHVSAMPLRMSVARGGTWVHSSIGAHLACLPGMFSPSTAQQCLCMRQPVRGIALAS